MEGRVDVDNKLMFSCSNCGNEFYYIKIMPTYIIPLSSSLEEKHPSNCKEECVNKTKLKRMLNKK
ncbi:hypothetical protein ACTXT7_013335 [Hymenolepis weldensis]